MTKYFKLWIFIFVILLFSCKSDDKPIDEDLLPSDPTDVGDLNDYSITISTFESYFTIQTHIIKDDQSQLNVSLIPIHTYSSVVGNASIKIYVTYMFGNVHLRTPYTFSFSLNHLVEKTEFLNTMYEDIQIDYIEVTYAFGNLKSSNTLTTSHKDYMVPPFIPEHAPEFVIEDFELNESLFLELDEELTAFLLRETYDYFTFSTLIEQSVTMNDEVESDTEMQLIQLTEGYLYYANSYEKGIVLEDNDRLIHYYMNPYYIVSNKQVLEVSVISHIDELDLPIQTSSVDQFFIPDVAKMKITKIDQIYIVQSYVKDILPTSEYQALSQQLRTLGIDVLILNQATMTFTFHILDDEFYMSAEMNIDFPLTQFSNLFTHLEIYYSFLPFVKEDIYSDKYTIEPPDEFNEIIDETYVLEEVRQELHAFNHKYLIYLEKGQYEFVDVDDQRLQLSFFDLELNRLYLTQATPHFYTHEYFIPEDGYYYINVHQGLSNNSGYAFYFNRRSYETTWFDVEILNFGINDVFFEGSHDFVRFKFNTEADMVLKIISNSNEVMIYPDNYFYADLTHFLVVPAGESYFTLVAFKELHIQLEVILINHTNYVTQDINLMEEITEEYSDLIVASPYLGARYLKLVVEEQALYTLHILRAGEAFGIHGVRIYNAQFQFISDFYAYGVILDVGTYVLKFGESSGSMGYVAYEKEIIEHLTFELNLTPVAYNSEINLNLSQYEAPLYFIKDYVDFHFESDEDVAFYIRGGHHYQILDRDRNPITFIFGTNFYTQENQIFYFEPGSYYLRIFSKFNFPNTAYVWLSFISNPPIDDNKVGSSVPYGHIGENVFEMTYPEDSELILLEISQAGKYTFTSNITGYATIYDANYNLVPSVNNEYQLSIGLYYVYFPNRGGSTRTLIISKK